MDGLPPDLKIVAKQELGETPEVRRDAVARLRTLVDEEPTLQCPLDEEFLVKFLRGRKYRVEEAFENIRVWNPGVCSLNEFFRAVIVGTEYCLLDQRFQIAGVVAVVDLEGLNFSHLLHYTPKELRKTIKLGQECYPLRIKGIYFVNNPQVFQLMYAVVKLFLNAKLIKRVHFIGHDYDQLHELVPRELLPEEYGGTLDNYDYDEFERDLLSTDTFFVELGKHGYREQRAQEESTEL
uniref:Putative tocopherol alpha transfer protein n=1 Tax=Ixodes ricinus TaxID=34613 RepID=V5HKT9_IXORI